MEPFLVAKVAVDKAALPFDKGYDYLVAEELRDTLKVGCRVLVPFGGANRKRQGVVLELKEMEEARALKPVMLQVDEEPLLTGDMMALVRWMKAYFFCTYFDAVRQILPAGAAFQAVAYYEALPASPEELDGLSADVRGVYLTVRGAKTRATESYLRKALGMQVKKSVEELVGKGLLACRETVRRSILDETVTMVSLPEDLNAALGGRSRKPTLKQEKVLSFLKQVGQATIKEACYFAAVTPAVLKTMEKSGLAVFSENQVYRSPYRRLGIQPVSEFPDLSLEQAKVCKAVQSDMAEGAPLVGLLYGVTGSGKTVVFLHLIRETVNQGKSCILLVPEIGLTPQMVDKFRSFFGDLVAVIHSGLSQGERMDEFQRIRRGEARIVVGTRSAVFAPVQNLGLIIMDEEQEQTYKSDASPRFHAKDVAKYRCVQHRCMLLLASATPSLDSYYHAQNGEYRYYELVGRYGDRRLPKVEMVDMREELIASGSAVFSRTLIGELGKNLERKEQSILLLNRRGFYTVVTCASCEEPVTCPNCSISLTYHQVNGQMMCHYCGYSTPMPNVCSHCGSELIRYSGYGTQKCEEELRRLFPEARVLRMDQDTTLTKDAHEKYFLQFSKGEYDILVGTQMVAKGLDFPRVTLVGVLAADQILYSNSFKGYEKAFSLLTQVVGRCGRAELTGRAFIQTYTPENPVFSFAVAQDYPRFYREEIENRKMMLYPPFCDVCTIGITGVFEDQVVRAGVDIVNAMRRMLAKPGFASLPVKVFGPVSWDVVKVNNKFRYKIVIKCRNSKQFRLLIRALLDEFCQDASHKKVSIFADFNFD